MAHRDESEKDHASRVREFLINNYKVTPQKAVGVVRKWNNMVRVGWTTRKSPGDTGGLIARYEGLKKKKA